VNNSDWCFVWFAELSAGKSSKPYHLEEAKVVTRFP
jgi:hypothetical protein